MTAEAPLATLTFAPGPSRDSVPTAVYIARDAAGSVLYVGITGSLAARMSSHRKNSGWWASAAVVDVEMWPDRPAASRRESELIALHRPRGNRREVRMAGWRRRRESLDAKIELMYQQGIPLERISEETGLSYPYILTLAKGLRNAGRIGYRQRPNRSTRPPASRP